LLCRRRQIADCHVLDHAAAQRADLSHRRLLSVEGWSDKPKPLRQECFASKSEDSCYRGAVSFNAHQYLDDNYIHLHGRRSINEVNLLWRDWFDGLYADGATAGRLMVLHLHPWIMGRPWRIRHLDEVLGQICAHQGVWKAAGG
jgi:hypothetical protein